MTLPPERRQNPQRPAMRRRKTRAARRRCPAAAQPPLAVQPALRAAARQPPPAPRSHPRAAAAATSGPWRGEGAARGGGAAGEAGRGRRRAVAGEEREDIQNTVQTSVSRHSNNNASRPAAPRPTAVTRLARRTSPRSLYVPPGNAAAPRCAACPQACSPVVPPSPSSGPYTTCAC